MTICPFKQGILAGDPIPEPARITCTIENNSGVSTGRALNTYLRRPAGIQSAVKSARAPYIEPAGIAIGFGWNSVGFGKNDMDL